MTTASTTDSANAELFPIPSYVRAVSAPRIWPGATPATSATLQDILKDNHERFHIFVNEMRYHNHNAHHMLALWALGADQSILKGAYEHDSKESKPIGASPNRVTDENWKAHLGDAEYYEAYLQFFTDKLKEKGEDGLFEDYIFAPSSNFAPGEKVQPVMLNRFLAALVHPMIHTGYGYEFGVAGMLVEGVAQTAVHENDSPNLLPATMFASQSTEDGLAFRFAKAVGLADEDGIPKKPVHALSVLARILADPRFESEKPASIARIYPDTEKKHAEAIRAYVDQWTLDGPIEEKVEQLVWAAVLIYGVGGWEGPDQPFIADFFSMHFVTSSLFLSSLVAHLSRHSQELLLRSYFAVFLTWYIGDGRAPIDIDGFLNDATREYPTPPGPLPKPHKDAVPSATSPKATTPNAWLAILQTALVHPDQHVPKLQRALAHYGEIYGDRRAGHFASVELKGAEKLDGTLFLRAAGLTAESTGWIREGERPAGTTWNIRSIYKRAT